MLPGTLQRPTTHDYKRSGTSSLYAFELSTGKVTGSLQSRHPAIEFKNFLTTLDRTIHAKLVLSLAAIALSWG